MQVKLQQCLNERRSVNTRKTNPNCPRTRHSLSTTSRRPGFPTPPLSHLAKRKVDKAGGGRKGKRGWQAEKQRDSTASTARVAATSYLLLLLTDTVPLKNFCCIRSFFTKTATLELNRPCGVATKWPTHELQRPYQRRASWAGGSVASDEASQRRRREYSLIASQRLPKALAIKVPQQKVTNGTTKIYHRRKSGGAVVAVVLVRPGVLARVGLPGIPLLRAT